MVIRIATYNVHKCRGLDRRTRPDRIADIVRELDADVVALQEVLSIENGKPEDDQARYIADQLGEYSWHFGENRRLRGGAYGNVTLSRLPVLLAHNYDLTWRGRERRGCLRTDLQIPTKGGNGCVLHLFNVHLGTGFVERRHQARRLTGEDVLRLPQLSGPKVVVGDFNEWTRGLATRLMAQQFDSVDLRVHLRRTRTYPGVLPVLHLDHFYFDKRLKLERFALDRSRKALIASDHLPMVAEFKVG
jgi:endonuclease/exonuclease/phosphatase family metal-dependent hydrolase